MFSDLLKALDGMGDICMTDSEDENNDSDEVSSSGNDVDDNGIQVVPGTPCLARFSEDQTIYRCEHKFSTRALCLIFDPSGPWC